MARGGAREREREREGGFSLSTMCIDVWTRGGSRQQTEQRISDWRSMCRAIPSAMINPGKDHRPSTIKQDLFRFSIWVLRVVHDDSRKDDWVHGDGFGDVSTNSRNRPFCIPTTTLIHQKSYRAYSLHINNSENESDEPYHHICSEAIGLATRALVKTCLGLIFPNICNLSHDLNDSLPCRVVSY